MTEFTPPVESEATGRTGVGRRAVLIGAGVAFATIAVGVPLTIALWPRPPAVEAMLAKRPFVVAHRGGSVDWPEMSEYAYAQSVALGVDALEMSVARTSDGVWIGAHDSTLDRTAGVSGFRIADHTWDEVRKLRILPPDRNPDQESRPYWRLTDLLDQYRGSHALWVDPKAVGPQHYPELMALLTGSVQTPAEVFVAKSDASNTPWAELAREEGLETWGFYYGDQLAADPGLFDRTQEPWTMLGLDDNATDAQWAAFAADGRPVVAHVLSRPEQFRLAVERGARGLMVSGVRELRG
ncbi:glycerophosphodiester phosphodiesterase [Microbacterium sp.]|uniref:glycerophosphodiester phosphodiesterase n=1 Tax=Microbacterium sp. TaxID=51671 RepID=UPI003F6E4EEE